MKTFAIVGDSYSTYKGYVPEDYGAWYTAEGNEAPNDLPSVDKTWWKQLIADTGLELVTNCSSSGTAVCYSGYEPMDKIHSSFIYRVQRELNKDACNPELIIIFGGTNDFWNNSPLGKLQYDNWTEDDKWNFGPAFCVLIDYLQNNHPQAKLVNIINDEITSEMRPMMIEACQHYGVDCLELKNIEKENGHPNTVGMRQITDQVIEFLGL